MDGEGGVDFAVSLLVGRVNTPRFQPCPKVDSILPSHFHILHATATPQSAGNNSTTLDYECPGAPELPGGLAADDSQLGD
jgi:hypothetical protein